MSTVKDIETKYDDTPGSIGKFFARELNIIKDTLSKFLVEINNYDDLNQDALYYAVKELSLPEVFKASGTDDLTLDMSSRFKEDKLMLRNYSIYFMLIENNNTGPVTIAVGDNVYDLINYDGTSLEADKLIANGVYSFIFDSDNNVFKLLTYVVDYAAHAQTSDVSLDAEKLVGIDGDKFLYFNRVVATEDYNANAFDLIECDTTDGSYTITLPSSPEEKDIVTVLDTNSSFENHNLKIARNGKKIMGLDEDMDCDVNNSRVTLYFRNNDWRLI